MNLYVPAIRRFAAHSVLLHSVIAEALGLHVTDLRALWLLGEAPRTAGELADELGLTSAAVTALVDRLERNGYAARQRSNTDRRKVTIQADPERLREVDSHYQSQNLAMAEVLDAYSEAEFAAIIDFLTRTADVLAGQARRAHDNHAPATSAKDVTDPAATTLSSPDESLT
jgi:DNA-binding MarR family transcriptional regulator